jgi:ADP-heptose:LPS heptosyltransferase
MSRVLLVRLDSEGDVLLMGPAVRAVAARAESVTFLCGPGGVQAAGSLPGVDEVLVHRAEWIDPEPPPLDVGATRALVEGLAARRFDEAIVFTSFHQSPLPAALLLKLAGIPKVSATSVDYPGSLLDVRHRISDDVHEVVRALGLAEAAGYPLPERDDARLRIERPARGVNPAGAGPYVVVHPGASVPARAMSAPRHAELVRELVTAGRRVVVTGSPDEACLTAEVADGEALDLGGRTSWHELADVIAGAAAVVVGNTGPAHLAAAVGTPVVSLFAPVIPAVRWRPWMVPHALLGDQDAPCAGSRARECPVAGHPCLDTIPVDEIVAALEALAPASLEVAVG